MVTQPCGQGPRAGWSALCCSMPPARKILARCATSPGPAADRCV